MRGKMQHCSGKKLSWTHSHLLMLIVLSVLQNLPNIIFKWFLIIAFTPKFTPKQWEG